MEPRRPAGGIEIDFELRFDLRATGLALGWLTDAFRTALDAADLADTGGVVMRALFDTSDTDVVTIQLRRPPRATRAARTEGGAGNRAPRTAPGLADPAPTLTAETDSYGRGTAELETATGTSPTRPRCHCRATRSPRPRSRRPSPRPGM